MNVWWMCILIYYMWLFTIRWTSHSKNLSNVLVLLWLKLFIAATFLTYFHDKIKTQTTEHYKTTCMGVTSSFITLKVKRKCSSNYCFYYSSDFKQRQNGSELTGTFPARFSAGSEENSDSSSQVFFFQSSSSLKCWSEPGFCPGTKDLQLGAPHRKHRLSK